MSYRQKRFLITAGFIVFGSFLCEIIKGAETGKFSFAAVILESVAVILIGCARALFRKIIGG
jgi:hypothetical protein